MTGRDSQIDVLLARLEGVKRGDDTSAVADALEAYARIVGDMRVVAVDARHRIEQAAAATAEAREYTRRRRRRVLKTTMKAADR